MKRFHVHLSVNNLDESIGFYSALFGLEPNVTKPDYAKWMLDDPRINFAISQRSAKASLDHLGMQVESDDELEALNQQFTQAALPVAEQKGTLAVTAKATSIGRLILRALPGKRFIPFRPFPFLAKIPQFPLKKPNRLVARLLLGVTVNERKNL